MKTTLSPKELDAQSPIKIDHWVDLDSDEWRELDDDPEITKRMMRIGFDAEALQTDSQGRIWGEGNNGVWYPFHFDRRGKKYGYRLPKQAAN